MPAAKVTLKKGSDPAIPDAGHVRVFPANDGILKMLDESGTLWILSSAKANTSASDPTVNDDNTQGYSVNSIWTNTTTDAVFICTDASTGAAVWKEVTAGGTNVQVDTGGSLASADFQDGGDINFAEAAGVVTATIKAGTTVQDIDPDAIHDDVSAEINSITEKVTPADADLLLIEDSAVGHAKKKLQISNLPKTDPDAIHDNVSAEIQPIANKISPVSADLLLIEDSAASWAKKNILGSALGNMHTLDSHSGTLGIAKGGTGQTSKTPAFDALAPGTTKGDIVGHDGSDNVRKAVGADDEFLVADSAQSDGLDWKAIPFSKGVSLINASGIVATSDATLFFTPVAITVKQTHAHKTGGTNVVFNINHASTRNGTGLDVFTSDITLTSESGQTNSSGFNDATIPANSWVWVDVVSVSGTVTQFHVTVEYTHD